MSSDASAAIARRHRETPEPGDCVEVGNLLQSYALYTDRGLRDELAALFTDDITWSGDELGYGSAQGRAAAVDTILAHHDPARPAVHLPGPPLLVSNGPHEIESSSWCIATRLEDGVARPLIHFAYEDVIRRLPGEGWLFARRVLRLRFRSG